MTRSRSLLILPTLALVLGAGCASNAAPGPTATTASLPTSVPTIAAPPSAAATPTVAPTGTPYHVNVPEALRGRWHGIIAGPRVTPGDWAMEITNNEIIVTNPKGTVNDAFAVGVTDITGDHVTFWDDPECLPVGLDTEGTYTYALQDDSLVFTEIDDSCGDRLALLTGATWMRLP
jgi:hypothetical protein